MPQPRVNKKKILNDPIYGFITIPNELTFDLIEHPYFQRLRRITQLGLTYLVYPGAYHTRFHHALGAMHLMQQAVSVLRSKGCDISDREEEAVYIGILLHDVGHGPFSHALETCIVPGVQHERISLAIMERLNEIFPGKLNLAMEIFKDEYPKKFLHQLISGQLDMDRLDYLRRDSFYSGVSEGQVGTERLLKMLNVANDQLVLDAKAVYSVEKFLVARRLMYWQVYLHKTVLVAEYILMNILRRGKNLTRQGHNLFATEVFKVFLTSDIGPEEFYKDFDLLEQFTDLDDMDIMASIKEWKSHEDPILARLSAALIDRRLFRIELSSTPFPDRVIQHFKAEVCEKYNIRPIEADYMVYVDSITNNLYDPKKDSIKLLYRDGSLKDVTEASDHLQWGSLQGQVTKHHLIYPKSCRPYSESPN
ncbi:MAG: HD domain-containing protein [Flavobacteriales bacterium]|nr:HD domain-containing protein [Flavobacteriales bacterium]